MVAGRGREIAEAVAAARNATLVLLGGKEFAAFRVVGPDWVLDLWDRETQSLRDDLARRDFTVNAFALALGDGRVEDPFGGLGDLARRLLRATTRDSFTASRLLHPELYRLFSGPLGAPFLAAIPERDTLVLFSNRNSLKRRIVKQVKKDHDQSAYPITPRLFLVTRDGIALAGRD